MTYAGDLTGTYSPGMRVRLTQTTVKYFVIVSVVYVNPTTTITLYGGALYTIANAPITTHDTVTDFIKQGFPLDLLAVSTVLMGLCPVLPDDATMYLDGTGAWTIPPSSPVERPGLNLLF